MPNLIHKNEKGMVLATGLMFMAIIAIVGTTAVIVTTTDLKIGSNYRENVQAFYIAEAGLARGEAELLNDLNTDFDLANGSYVTTSGTIALAYNAANFNNNLFTDIPFGEGFYTIQLKNYPTSPENKSTIWVRSIGTGPNSSTVTLECYLSAENISPWNNAIFAGGGGGTVSITGNVIIAGSIHILGDGLLATDTVFNNQTGDCRNTNVGMDGTLAAKIDGGTTSDLNAKFRVKNGLVDMTLGSAGIGSLTSPFKGIYVTDGDDAGADGVNDDIIGGDNAGAGQNLYADKGASSVEAYDLGDYPITLPAINITDMNAHSLDFGGPLTLSTTDISTQSGTFGGVYCSISFNAATKELTIVGIIKATSLNISADITYTGRGTIYTTGTATVDGDVLPIAAASYPTTNVFGVVSTGDMTLGGSSQILLTGAYYSAGEISTNMQTELAGTIVCKNFDITNQVPSIWQVPSLAANLSPGMPGSAAIWVFTDRTWREMAE